METVRQGATGATVELLQATLKRAGYDPGNVDGIFGAQTRSAVIAFQRANELVADGIVGPNTWRALRPYMVGYITHRIQAGDTLFRLAQTYGTNVAAIETANPGIQPQRLQIGQRITIPFGFPVVYTNISFTYQVLELCIEGLQARYPFVQSMRIGNSVNGRKLYCLAIGQGRNEAMYNASHHANEWINTPVLMKFLEEYASAYATGKTIGGRNARSIFDTTTLYIVPMVNPDGVDLVTGGIPKNSAEYRAAQALNTPPLAFPDAWKANIVGVDLNLNYPAGWEEAREIKFAQGYTKPGPRDYVGPEPLSEPESQAMAAFTRRHAFTITLSYHSQGEVIYWKYLDYNPTNSYEIAQRFGRVSGYTVEETPITSGYAGYKDWFIQDFNKPGYTIETGRGINPLPITQFDRIYQDNLGILVLAAVVTA